MAKPDKELLGIAPAFGSEEHAKALNHVLGRLSEAEKLHEQLVPAWTDNYRAWRAMQVAGPKRKKLPWQTNVRHPYIAEQLKALVPRFSETMAEWDVRPGLGVPREVAWKKGHLLNTWTPKAGLPLKSGIVALHQMLFGVTWGMTGFAFRQVPRQAYDPDTGELVWEPVTIRNQGSFDVGHPLDVMWDPFATWFEDCRYVVWRTITTVGQIRAKERRKVEKGGRVSFAGMYENVEHVHGMAGMKRGEHGDWPNEVEVPEHVTRRMPGAQQVELLTVFDRELDRLTTVANRNVVIRDHRLMWRHGDIPVSCAVTNPDVGVLHGIPDVEWMKPVQTILHELEQKKLDNMRLQMDFILLVRDTVEDLNQLILEPGAKWPVEDPDDVTALQYPQPQLASIQEIEQWRGRLQAIGGTGYMTGADPTSMGMNQDTATGVVSIIEQGNVSIDSRAALLRLMWDRVGEQWLSLASQYLLEDVELAPASKNGQAVVLTPDELAQDTYVVARMDSKPGLESLRINRMTQMAQVAGMLMGTPIPTAKGMQQFNPLPIIEELADAVKREPEAFLGEPDQANAMMQAMDPSMAAAVPQAPMQVPMGAGVPLG